MKSTVETKIIELVKSGHERAADLKASCGAVDVRSVAQLISDLASQLEVQFARSNALAAENAGLKAALEYCINPDNQPEYHDLGMGCGVEDHGYQRDGYSACVYGWDSAMERVYSEVIPDAIPETPATDAFLAEVQAHAIRDALDESSDYLDTDCVMDRLDISYEDAELRTSGAIELHDALVAVANQLRKGE
ncbi:hypothetical protein R1917_13945 [Citrobacter koseri]|uniref:hypothetical protein n=1 Tax=Citrobacter koseri TaxID=545 RepID=UPI00294292DB|nr:hypothetical protein [Citrobacter koseri]WOJ29050.1 hypothetical protein R1917_13945 [Citrobacter koseri]WOJ37543.1 hypothetical protein R1243_11495 [Citrobacter koseri]